MNELPLDPFEALGDCFTAIDRAMQHGARVTDIIKLSRVRPAHVHAILNGDLGDWMIDEKSYKAIHRASNKWILEHPEWIGMPDIRPYAKRKVIQRVQKLAEIGYPTAHIAWLVGTKTNRITSLVRGDMNTVVSEAVALKLEGIPTDKWHRIATPIGATRRVRSLVRWGYSPAELAEAMGIPIGRIEAFLFDVQDSMTREEGLAIGSAFIELELTPGKSLDAINRGIKEGWPLPFQWEEDRIDQKQGKLWKARPNKPARELTDAERDMAIRKEFYDLMLMLEMTA